MQLELEAKILGRPRPQGIAPRHYQRQHSKACRGLLGLDDAAPQHGHRGAGEGVGWASTSHGSRRSQSSLHLSPPQVALRQRGNADKLRARHLAPIPIRPTLTSCSGFSAMPSRSLASSATTLRSARSEERRAGLTGADCTFIEVWSFVIEKPRMDGPCQLHRNRPRRLLP